MNTALMIIDIQNDYFPNGKMELHNAEQAASNAAKILEWFRQNNKDNIFHVQHIAKNPSATFFLPDTEGVLIHASVKPLDSESITIKHSANSFLNTDLEKKLRERNITNLVIVGMMTHMCIDTTVRAASDLGFQVVLIEDACATKALSYKGIELTAEQVHYSFIAALNGRFAQVVSTEEFFMKDWFKLS